jgi:signal transduction histidine kinase
VYKLMMIRGVWRSTVHVLTGLPVGSLGAAMTLPPLLMAGVTIAPLRAAVIRRTRGQRRRYAVLLRVDIPAIEGMGETGRRTSAVWRQAAFHLLSLPIGAIGFVIVATGWSVGLAMLAAPLYGSATILVGFGLGLVIVAAASAYGIARLDAALAVRMLGPSAAEALDARLAELTRTRSQAVAAADAERRRIERDLHDGTQQQLVALAMTLGLARAQLPDGPGREIVHDAHLQVKDVLTELRGFVRGLHPRVLDDRGLDAALSGLVAQVPQPVELHVEVSRRCPPVIEAIAYFVVSEALTNITRHARADKVEVAVVLDRDRLRITVIDDGVGGADERPDGGLQGLAQRAMSVDGTLRIESPSGGPTLIEVTLPCGS